MSFNYFVDISQVIIEVREIETENVQKMFLQSSDVKYDIVRI